MRIPLSWLRQYVDFDLPAEELAHRLSMAGTEVEKIERTGDWDDVVVGHVRNVSQHPNADRLSVVTVDHGGGTSEVVCGAPNVAAGQKIAYASVGAHLIDGYSGKPSRLKRAKIRGVVSEGMVCSEKELGLGESHEGILVLDPDAEIGRPLGDVIGDTVLELELTPNRPDCLGIVGVAREVSAFTGAELRQPCADYPAGNDEVASLARVVIQDPDLCPRYTASVIRGVKIGPSPKWLADALASIGERPINNVVDATNYVMFELGQPLHAFDYDRVVDHNVVVRRARDGELLTTLDEVERKLTGDMLVISDPERAIGLAGVMGGANTEIDDSTVNVFLESATFDSANNRRTSRSLGLQSQATLRFEKGLRAGLSEVALRRTTRLILEVASGEAANGIIDEWPAKGTETARVFLSADKLLAVLGSNPGALVVETTLTSLGFGVTTKSEGWDVTVPYWRPDVSIPEDLCEEVARTIGYDKIPLSTNAGDLAPWAPVPGIELRDRVEDILADTGLQQIITYSATSPEGEARIDLPPSTAESLRIQNPVSGEHAVLRTTLREGVLQTTANNLRTWRGPISIYESGLVFHGHGEGLPDERPMVVGALTGPGSEPHWDGANTPLDYYDARGAVEEVLEQLGINAEFVPGQDPTLAEGRTAHVKVAGSSDKRIGVVGEVDPGVLARFGIDSGPVALFELDMTVIESIVANETRGKAYEPWARFPESARDMAIVIDEAVDASEVLAIASRNKLVTFSNVIDIYRGRGLPPGKKSLTFRLTMQSPSRTLTSGQVDRVENAILRSLQNELGAEQRQ